MRRLGSAPVLVRKLGVARLTELLSSAGHECCRERLEPTHFEFDRATAKVSANSVTDSELQLRPRLHQRRDWLRPADGHAVDVHCDNVVVQMRRE